MALSVLDVLDDDEVGGLFGALTPITRKVVDAGDVPAATPMGLGRDNLTTTAPTCPSASWGGNRYAPR